MKVKLHSNQNEKLTAAPSPVSVAASAPKFHPVAGAAGDGSTSNAAETSETVMKSKTNEVAAEAKLAIPFILTDMRCRLFPLEAQSYVADAIKQHTALVAVADEAAIYFATCGDRDSTNILEAMNHLAALRLAAVRAGSEVAK